ncbi:MAG: hypothetical protein CMP50_03715 [Flavobacteriales bacterium]|jgi:hypothetical protein|nr:hypothetical protein [Flavobacteriales bacterium]
MDDITIGHWLFALFGSLIYILFCFWGYKKEQSLYTKFNYRILPVIFYMGLILVFLILIS